MIPDFQTIMLPLLESLSDGEEHPIKQIHDNLAAYFELNNEELIEKLPGGDQLLFYAGIHEAKSHLLKADLLQHTNSDFFKITPLGKQVLHKRPNLIDTNFLKRLPGYS